MVALGGRRHGQWQRADLSALGTLLACTLGVVFFGFIPDLILAAHLPAERAWRVSAFLFASYHLMVIVGAFWSRRVLRGPEEPVAGPVLSLILAPSGFALIVSQFITAAGFFEPWLLFVYLANLLWLLLVATILFALLVIDLVSARTAA